MLLALRDFIQREKMVSSEQMTRAFQIDEMTLKPMLEFWLRKGIIKKCQPQVSCKSRCSRCRMPPEYYQIC
ncbi:hypothetical protein FOG18_13585 [Legionella israelensis]|uniref:FeoC-like transcriptional regulator n=1 Tax=Legionella israelensis TaxID=454 RepID=UPI00117C9E83|nr:FeoC-like transcriptional regulator [Legionella israelensis]QDP73521.1 hypothetical protein FOG18_13585 [Legionella israelensis]